MRCTSCHSELPEGAAFCPSCGARCADTARQAAFEYAAFISYRHRERDQAVAKRVQKAIETYRMPRGTTAFGRADRRIGTCFRDEDELAAAHSLPRKILDALARSSALIVVCSPGTQESLWVQREITAFIEMHGRERVFAVLAEGSSAESIPDLLRSDAVEMSGGAHAGPLAADLRPEAASRAREETLRVVAAVAGCDYDALKQRDRTRRLKRAALIAACAVAIAAALAGALVFASHARHDAQTAESHQLAAESAELLAQGDRYGAIAKALEALPASKSSGDRPYVAEARTALENALQLDFDENHPWNLRYSLSAEGEIVSIEESPDAGWFAILDSDLVLTIHDIDTGKALSTVHLLELVDGTPADTDLDPGMWTIAAAGERLIASERDGSCVLCCIEAKSGEVVWTYRDPVDALSVSDDGQTLDMLCQLDEQLSVGAIDIPSGERFGTLSFDIPGREGTGSQDTDVTSAPTLPRLLPSRMGTYASTFFVGFANVICGYDLVDNTVATAELGESDFVSSIAHVDGTVIATSASFLGEDPSSPDYRTSTVTVSALDGKLEPLWTENGTWTTQVVDSKRGYVGPQQFPEASEVALVDGPAIAVLAGKTAQLISVKSGEALYEESFDLPLVGLDAVGSEEAGYTLYATCADGTTYQRIIERGTNAGGPIAFTFPGPVDLAEIDWFHAKGCFALARSLDDPHVMFVYRAETRTAQDALPASDYSLDELLSMAHDELEASA